MGERYDNAISFKELYNGLEKSRRNVLWKDSVAGYSANALKNTYLLRQSLLNRTYVISPYQQFTLHEPKERDILATRIKDRQYQRSICDNILYDDITRIFIRDNVACQRGKGVDDAIKRMKTHLRRYYRENGKDGWVMQGDIRKYFPSTMHSVAIDHIVAAVKDGEAAACAAGIIESFSVPAIKEALSERGASKELADKLSHSLAMLRVDVATAYILYPSTLQSVKEKSFQSTVSILPKFLFLSDTELTVFADWIINGEFKGVGLGSQVSQLVELLVLNDLDHFIKERLRVKYYIRYMDDFILIHPDKEYLQYCMSEIKARVTELGLSLNQKTEIYPIKHGVRILKWRFILTDTGKIIMKMNPKSITKEKRKLRKLKKKVDNGEIPLVNAKESLDSWRANAERGNTKMVVHNMEKYYTELFKEVQ